MKFFYILKIILLLVFFSNSLYAQNCPPSATSILNSNPDTYYPGVDNSVAIGSKSITLGTAGYGNTPIGAGDLLLIIQMQGAQINSTNTTSYGDGISGGTFNGYLNNSALQAGNMEYIVATNTVALGGGTLNLLSGTVNAYKNAAYGSDGQYRYQVIRIGIYYNLNLTGTITAANWNGTSGGVLVLTVTNTLNFNGQKLTAAAAGFHGGAARQLNGGGGGLNTDVVTLSTQNFNGSKAEGIAGTPRFIDDHGVIVDNGNANEGYPGGSYAAGAPGNAGGGGTDGNPSRNDENSGGGGGGNGGLGGRGGNSWNSNLATGGQPGAVFAQSMPSRLVMGGGGGAGTTNNGTGSFSAGFSSSGAAGGGIVLLTANIITGTGTIDVSGESAFVTVLNDGSGGGGAGGSALIFAGSGLSNITVKANGGTGGTNTGTGSPHGPGGGGGGGVIYSNDSLNSASGALPGLAGYTAFGSTQYNAAAGNSGVINQHISRSQVPNQFLNCTLLPVTFQSVDAKWQKSNAVIEWSVANACGVQSYMVEKSKDGINYNLAGLIFGSYTFTDTKNPGNENTWYRIKETDDNSNFSYSISVLLKKQIKEDHVISIFPNPAVNAQANIVYNTQPGSKTLDVRLFSLNGRLVWQRSYKPVIGQQSLAMEGLTAIPNGIYLVQIMDGKNIATTKLLVQH